MKAYAYFNRDGKLLEFVSDNALREGNRDVNDIYIYVEGLTRSKGLSGVYKDISTDTVYDNPQIIANTVVNEAFPSFAKYDPKVFITGKSYDFVKVTIPNTTDLPVLGTAGSKQLTITVYDSVADITDPDATPVFNLGLITFYVDISHKVQYPTLTRSQFDYLLAYLSTEIAGKLNITSGIMTSQTRDDLGDYGQYELGQVFYIKSDENKNDHHTLLQLVKIGNLKAMNVLFDFDDVVKSSDLASKEDKLNKKTVINEDTINDTNYPTTKAVRDFVNNVSAYYITKNAQGDAFNSVAELQSATTFYSGGQVRIPTRNDYCIVRVDENHDNATTRYWYQGNQWEYQYLVNETPLSQEQLDALNSGITEEKIKKIDEKDNELQDQINDIEDRAEKKNDLINNGCIRYSDGTVSPDAHTKHTNYIYIINRKSLTYNGATSPNIASIAFYDKNKNYLQSISIAGTSSGIIDLTQSQYEEAYYAIVSAYSANDNFSAFYLTLNEYKIPIGLKNINDEFAKYLKDVQTMNSITHNFVAGHYLNWSNGKEATNTNGGVTDFVDLKDVEKIIYGIVGGTTLASVAFYDKDKNYIQSISIQGNGAVGFGIGCLDITQTVYANAKYVRASVYVAGANFTNQFFITVGKENTNQLLPNFANKNVLIFGDSITDCCYFRIDENDKTLEYYFNRPSSAYTKDGTLHYFDMWPLILRKKYQFNEIRNYAKFGASFVDRERTSGNERQNLSYQIKVALNDLDNPNNAFPSATFSPDIIIFALGTNDSANGLVNDTYETAMAKTVYKTDNITIDIDATLANLDKTKFNEAVRFALLTMKKNFPMAQMYVSLPIQRASYDIVGTDLIKCLRQMAERYGCVIIDATTKSGITRDGNIKSANGETLYDGLHPNEKGQNLLARTIITSIKENYIDFDRMNH